MREFVYFISDKDGPIKIGKARNVPKRLSGIQTSNPNKLEVMGVMVGKPGLEDIIHRKFEGIRYRGEWFNRDNDLMAFIEKHSFPAESVFYNYDRAELMDKIKALEDRLKNKEREIEISLLKGIRDKIEDDLTNHIANALFDLFEYHRAFHGFTSQIGAKFTGGGIDDFEKASRRAIDDLLSLSWHDSKMVLHSDNISFERFKEFAADWLAKRFKEHFGSFSCRRKKWTQKTVILEKQLDEAIQGNYGN